MTWEEKLLALQSLTSVSLRMRALGDWYVEANGMSIKEGSMLVHSFGNGKTPKDAIDDHWRQYVEFIPSDRYIVLENYRGRKAVRWNGFMWSEVIE